MSALSYTDHVLVLAQAAAEYPANFIPLLRLASADDFVVIDEPAPFGTGRDTVQRLSGKGWERWIGSSLLGLGDSLRHEAAEKAVPLTAESAAAPLVGDKPSLMWRFVHAALRPLLGRARP